VPEREILNSLLEQGAPPLSTCQCPEALGDMVAYGTHYCKDGQRIAPEEVRFVETDELPPFNPPLERWDITWRDPTQLADSLEDFLPASRWERLNDWLRDWVDTIRYDLGDALIRLGHRIHP
jgi:hypothetical protein